MPSGHWVAYCGGAGAGLICGNGDSTLKARHGEEEGAVWRVVEDCTAAAVAGRLYIGVGSGAEWKISVFDKGCVFTGGWDGAR